MDIGGIMVACLHGWWCLLLFIFWVLAPLVVISKTKVTQKKCFPRHCTFSHHLKSTTFLDPRVPQPRARSSTRVIGAEGECQSDFSTLPVNALRHRRRRRVKLASSSSEKFFFPLFFLFFFEVLKKSCQKWRTGDARRCRWTTVCATTSACLDPPPSDKKPR